MGLDITAYQGLSINSNPVKDEDGWYDGFQPQAGCEWAEKNWPGRTEGIIANACYTAADEFGFRAGSYSGYNRWRSELANMAGYGSAKSVWDKGSPPGPFVELINFADNEGVIGPVVSAKLAKDFADHQHKAEAHAATLGAEGFYWLERYGDWRKAFEMAADNGAIEFH